MDLQSSSANLQLHLESVNITVTQTNLKTVISNYYEKDSFSEEKLSFEIIENKPVYINFESDNSNARLYIYGMEALIDDRLEQDDYGETYLKPSNSPFDLYKKDYYPLIPGLYVGKLAIEDKSYYLPFKIIPKQVSEDQLKVLKEDIEHTMKGLAIDFVKKIYSADDNSSKVLPPKVLKHFMIIKKHYPYVLSALTDLYKKANYRIQKEYRWTKDERANRIDQVTVRTMQTKSFYDGQLKTPYNVTNYNLLENKWIKFIIRNVLFILDEFMASLREYESKTISDLKELNKYSFQESTYREILEKNKVTTTIKEYYDLVYKMRAGFQIIVGATWYQEIDNESFATLPHNLYSDARYRAIYQLYRDLKEEDISVAIDSDFVYQWKRTDKLYEIWGFIKILNLLVELGFKPQSGWIYDKSVEGRSFLIPYLSSGEKIVFKKEDIRIHLVYDGILPMVSHETHIDNVPLYMGKHNRPDSRIDFYKQDIYGGTLMIDYKYRPVNRIWDNSSYNSLKRSKGMEQLIAYKRDSNSPYLYGEEQGQFIRDYLSPRPVVEVWALHPEYRTANYNNKYFVEDSIRIMRMSPGQGLEDIKTNLKDTFKFLDIRFEELKPMFKQTNV